MLRRKKEKLNSYLEGFRHMKKLPDIMFVIDTVKEHIAVQEARRLGMKVVAPVDTNCDPDMVDYLIPGNDDAIRSVNLFCQEIANAIIEGKAAYAETHGEEVAEAPTSAEVEEIVSEAASEIEADDLTKIAGIGKAYQEKLNNEGFYTYADVANMNDEQIAMMEEKYSFKGDFKESVASAKELAEA